jgi:uncharacterized Zn finger protein
MTVAQLQLTRQNYQWLQCPHCGKKQWIAKSVIGSLVDCEECGKYLGTGNILQKLFHFGTVAERE